MQTQTIPENSLPPIRVTRTAIKYVDRDTPETVNFKSLVRLAYRSWKWFYLGDEDKAADFFVPGIRPGTEYALAVDDYGHEWVLVFAPEDDKLIMVTAHHRFLIPSWLEESTQAQVDKANSTLEEDEEPWEYLTVEDLHELCRTTIHTDNQLTSEEAAEMTDRETPPSCGLPFLSQDENWVVYFNPSNHRVSKVRPVLFELGS